MKQDLTGKVALVTGANTGIGRVTALQLAKRGAHVFLACRSKQKAQPVVDEIRQCGVGRGEFLHLDLGDLVSVRECAEDFLARQLPLHILVANAGLAGKKGMTASGFELSFGVCHVGHFQLVKLLKPCLLSSAPARVVVVSSKAHRHLKALDLDAVRQPTRSPGGLKEYGAAKLANLLFAKELGRRLEGTGVTVYAVHPGIVASDIWRRVPQPMRMLIRRFMVSPEEGAQTSLYCATDESLALHTGGYYERSQQVAASPLANDINLAGRLWHASENWVNES
ncbi:SDR family oxidoreductase [Alcanivorax sp.]|jgi:NAD(P)-dependent dehydrogenase (short-subunit alcohol dehydrogenase family)|uniref:SDR family oxidoreductase n=1 Tax=Alcanivorax sp. TaxID=1872427 RepID=UPI0032D943B5